VRATALLEGPRGPGDETGAVAPRVRPAPRAEMRRSALSPAGGDVCSISGSSGARGAGTFRQMRPLDAVIWCGSATPSRVAPRRFAAGFSSNARRRSRCSSWSTFAKASSPACNCAGTRLAVATYGVAFRPRPPAHGLAENPPASPGVGRASPRPAWIEREARLARVNRRWSSTSAADRIAAKRTLSPRGCQGQGAWRAVLHGSSSCAALELRGSRPWGPALAGVSATTPPISPGTLFPVPEPSHRKQKRGVNS
jgi:hypothetical protein